MRVTGELEVPPIKLIALPAVAFSAKEYAKLVFAALIVISRATFHVPPKILIAVALLGPMVRSPLPLILSVAPCTVAPSSVGTESPRGIILIEGDGAEISPHQPVHHDVRSPGGERNRAGRPRCIAALEREQAAVGSHRDADAGGETGCSWIMPPLALSRPAPVPESARLRTKPVSCP